MKPAALIGASFLLVSTMLPRGGELDGARLIVLVMTQRMPTDLEVQVKAKTLAYQAITDK